MKKIPLRARKKQTEQTPESAILAGLQRAYDIMMPSAIIGSLRDAGFVIMSEDQLDAEVALAYQAGEESGRER